MKFIACLGLAIWFLLPALAAPVPGGTRVLGPITPTDDTDQYATHDARWGRGGHRTVADINARNAIPMPRREPGMLVWVEGAERLYRLRGDLTNWTEFGETVRAQNRTELLSLGPLSTNAVVQLLGYHAAGDGGGGSFFYAPGSGATNLPNAPAPGGAFQRANPWDGNPRAFGLRANFDEVSQTGTDDTAALEAAVQYAAANGYELVLPGGNILFESISLNTDYLKIRGAGKLKTKLFSNSTNRNAILVQSAHNSFSDFSVYATTLRSNVTASTTGTNLNGILFYDFSDGLGGGLELREMYVRGHPGSGVAIAGSMEKLYAKGVEADFNRRNGFESVQIGALGGFSSTLENCRFTDNGNAGIWLSGASSFTLISPQTWRNGPRWNMVLTNCVQTVILNADVEGHGYGAEPLASYGPTNNLSFTANAILCDGCDFSAMGFSPNRYVSVHGSTSADGLYWVDAVAATNISVEHSFASVPTESAGATVTIQASTRPVGVYDKNGIGNQYIGGNFNSLFAGIVANALRDGTVVTPRIGNFATNDPVIPFGVFLSGGTGFNHGNFIRTLMSPTGSRGPIVGAHDRDRFVSSNLVMQGNQVLGRWEVVQPPGGIRPLVMSRPDNGERFSWFVSTAGIGLYDEARAQTVLRTQSSASSPAITIGDENNTHTATTARLRAAQRVGGAVDLAGIDLVVDGGAGTGSNQIGGGIVFRTAEATVSGTGIQSLVERVRILPGPLATNQLPFQVRIGESTNWQSVITTNMSGVPVWMLQSP